MNSADEAGCLDTALTIELVTSNSAYSLRPLLFKGGAKISVRTGSDLSQCEGPLRERIPLVDQIHDVLCGRKEQGQSHATIMHAIYEIFRFFRWADDTGREPSLKTLERDYLEYTEHLIHRNRLQKNLSDDSTYRYASTLAGIFDDVLNLKSGLLKRSRIRRGKKPLPWNKPEQFSMDEGAQEMGSALLRLCRAVTLSAIKSTLPRSILLKNGKQANLPPGTQQGTAHPDLESTVAITAGKDPQRSAINLRIEAEMLIFISQTGMNLDQARTQKVRQFHFTSSNNEKNCLDVTKAYKPRRGGEVEFHIYKEYKSHFLEYLMFRSQLFPDDPDGLLFKFIDVPGRSKPRFYELVAVRNMFRRAGVAYRTPRMLRSIRLNDLLERTNDPILVADMGQHSPDVLLRNYERPKIKTAIKEVARYHSQIVPAFNSPGPGKCITVSPEVIADAPSGRPTPDCRTPSGCLFCMNHRDIRSLDHIWSLLSLRYLKSMELSKYHGNDADSQPAYLVIQRISEKAQAIGSTDDETSQWLKEAEERVAEYWFHPAWAPLIHAADMNA
jgi:integrase